MGSSADDKPLVIVHERIEVIAQVGTDPSSIPGSDGEHRLQQKYGKTTHAMAFYKHQVLDHINSAMEQFLARQEMMFVGTADTKGNADSSFRCGHAGFVKVLDERTVAYPEYRGNGVMASLGNISENPRVGLLFIDFGDQIGLHINGGAKILRERSIPGVPEGPPSRTSSPGGRSPKGHHGKRRWTLRTMGYGLDSRSLRPMLQAYPANAADGSRHKMGRRRSSRQRRRLFRHRPRPEVT